jgi:hypothetical protein
MVGFMELGGSRDEVEVPPGFEIRQNIGNAPEVPPTTAKAALQDKHCKHNFHGIEKSRVARHQKQQHPAFVDTRPSLFTSWSHYGMYVLITSPRLC